MNLIDEKISYWKFELGAQFHRQPYSCFAPNFFKKYAKFAAKKQMHLTCPVPNCFAIKHNFLSRNSFDGRFASCHGI